MLLLIIVNTSFSLTSTCLFFWSNLVLITSFTLYTISISIFFFDSSFSKFIIFSSRILYSLEFFIFYILFFIIGCVIKDRNAPLKPIIEGIWDFVSSNALYPKL